MRWSSRAGLVGLVLLVSCSAPPPAPRQDASVELTGSVTQFRPDEGTRQLRAGVTNHGSRAVTITAAGIAWSGFARRPARVPDGTIGPGETTGFGLEYGDAECADPLTGRPRMAVVVDGAERLVPLEVMDPDLLTRIHARECAQALLDRTAAVTLHTTHSMIEHAGRPYLRASLEIRRRAGSTEPVELVDLAGSVLLSLTPARGPHALPTTLGAGDRRLRVPLLIGSTHRCDPHALGQSQQTFLFSIYVRRGDDPVQRLIRVPDAAAQAEAMRVIHRDCR